MNLFSARGFLALLVVTVAVTMISIHRLHSSHEQHGRGQRSVGARQLITAAAHTGIRHMDMTGVGGNVVGSSSSSSSSTATKDLSPDPKKVEASQRSPLLPPPVQMEEIVTHDTELTAAERAAADSEQHIYYYNHTELWGEVVVWGGTNKKASAEDCCEQCRDHKPDPGDPDALKCNVCVYCPSESCGEHKGECWLKHLVRPEGVRPAKQGSSTPWVAGTIGVNLNQSAETIKPTGERKFHIVTSAQGAAVHWQCRIHYYWYLKQKAACEKAGPCDMGGWTRLLHSGEADDLMDELPTTVVDPLPKDLVEHNWYVVLNRPYAFVQWVKIANIPERFVYMAEPDHIMLRPIPNFMRGSTPASFPFFYIEPYKKETSHITRKFTGPITRAQLEEIAPIGNSPTFMTMEDMKKTMQTWMNVSIAIFKDPEASKEWGWVQEMYGFTIALWKVGVRKVDLWLNMMAQPPWDTNMEMSPGRPFYILHYTYGNDFNAKGDFTPGKFGEWRFDKRTYMHRPLPRNVTPPPDNVKNELVKALISSLNEASAAIPCWPQYAKTGIKPASCDEKPGGFLADQAALKSA